MTLHSGNTYTPLTEDNGVQKFIIKSSSNGDVPPDGARVFIHFVGSIHENENETFDKRNTFLNTRDRGSQFSFVLGEDQTIPGLDLAISTMREGEIASVICKPHYAYGAAGNPQGFHSMGKPIPPNSNLKFDIEFLSFDILEPEGTVLKMTVKEKMEATKQSREEGNQFFKEGRYEKAYRRYAKSIEYLDILVDSPDRKNQLLLCHINMAACRLKTGDWREVVTHATKALEIDSNNIKALFRRGKAYSELNEYEKADEDLNKVLTLESNNTEAKQQLNKVKQKMKETEKKEKVLYGTIFNKLNKEEDKSLYEDVKAKEEPETRKCNICNEEIETIQWARHIIKKHGSSKKT